MRLICNINTKLAIGVVSALVRVINTPGKVLKLIPVAKCPTGKVNQNKPFAVLDKLPQILLSISAWVRFSQFIKCRTIVSY